MSRPVGQISRLLGEEESAITLKKQTKVNFQSLFCQFIFLKNIFRKAYQHLWLF